VNYPFKGQIHTIHVYWKGVKRYTEKNGNDILSNSGVYQILIKKKDEDSYMRWYVGHADDLNDRYFQHLSDSEESENIRNRIDKYICGFDYALIDS
jgi:excinuclease UvrABC nuclease subunit